MVTQALAETGSSHRTALTNHVKCSGLSFSSRGKPWKDFKQRSVRVCVCVCVCVSDVGKLLWLQWGERTRGEQELLLCVTLGTFISLL